MHKIFWKFLRQIGTFLDHLGGVDTSMGGALVPKNQAKLSKCMGEGEVNISASIRAPYPKFFGKFMRHIGTFLDHLGGVDPLMGRSLAPKIQAKLSKCMGDGGSISQLLIGPHEPSCFRGSGDK